MCQESVYSSTRCSVHNQHPPGCFLSYPWDPSAGWLRRRRLLFLDYQLLSICHDVLKTYMLRCSPVRTSLLLSQSLLKTRCARRRRKVRPRRYSGSLTSVTLMALAQSVRNAEKLMIHQIAKRKCYASFFALPLRGRMG